MISSLRWSVCPRPAGAPGKIGEPLPPGKHDCLGTYARKCDASRVARQHKAWIYVFAVGGPGPWKLLRKCD